MAWRWGFRPFLQLIGSLAGNLYNTVRTFPVMHELLLLTLEEDFLEYKFVWHKGMHPDVPVEALGDLLLVSNKFDSDRLSSFFGQVFVGG